MSEDNDDDNDISCDSKNGKMYNVNVRRCIYQELLYDVPIKHCGELLRYVTHIVSALTEAAASYARYKQRPQEEILTTIQSSISSTLTDRAAVNACVTRQLRDEFELQLLQLNCNVHPLDSVTRTVKSSLKGLDNHRGISGNCYGSNGTAANLINAVSVLRFKDGTGDPLGFKNFLRENNLAIGTFVRYVGNRIHVLFHLAGTLVTHQAKLIEFNERKCTAAGLIRVLKDLKNDKIMAQVWALGVLGKILSGPWMTKFYSSEMSNLEMGPWVRQCVGNLHSWIETPASILPLSKDAFGRPLDPQNDDVLSALLSYDTVEESLQEEALTTTLQASLTILERQLKEFISGDFLEPTSEMIEKCAAAPTHNMASERALGCLDKMWRRAPNATVGFLTGKVKCKMNKTLQWLDQKDPQEREDLVRFVVSEAREERARKFTEQKGLLGEIAVRRKEVSDQRYKSKKSSAVRDYNKCFKNQDVHTLSCPNNLKDRVQKFFANPDSVVGVLVIHTIGSHEWFDPILRALPIAQLERCYWTINETESSAVDFKLPASQFFADAILGNIIFL